jgi:hypothetical protein
MQPNALLCLPALHCRHQLCERVVAVLVTEPGMRTMLVEVSSQM